MFSAFASRIARLDRSTPPSKRNRFSPRLSVAELESRAVPATGLGVANSYSAFILEDANLFYSDVQGKVAVGGDASFSGYSVADQYPNTNGAEDTLIVGGDLTFVNGQINSGNVHYAGTGYFDMFGLPNGTKHNSASPIDFNAAGNELRALADSYAALATNGTIKTQYGIITLTGTKPGQNVFNISAATLWNANTFTIKAPAGSSVIVNITGTNARMQYMGYNLQGGVDNDNVILNFHNAENLTLAGIGIFGNVLAPRAAVDFSNGQLNGTLVAESWCGYGQVNYERPPVCEPPPPPCEPPPPPDCPPPPPECPPEPPPCDPPPPPPPPPPPCEPEPPPCDPEPPCPPPPPPECPPEPPPCEPPPPPPCEPEPPPCDPEPPCPPPPPPPPPCEPEPPPCDPEPPCPPPPPPPPPCEPEPPPCDPEPPCPPPPPECPPEPPVEECPPCEPGAECPPCEPEVPVCEPPPPPPPCDPEPPCPPPAPECPPEPPVEECPPCEPGAECPPCEPEVPVCEPPPPPPCDPEPPCPPPACEPPPPPPPPQCEPPKPPKCEAPKPPKCDPEPKCDSDNKHNGKKNGHYSKPAHDWNWNSGQGKKSHNWFTSSGWNCRR